MKKLIQGAWSVLKKIWKPVAIAVGALLGIGLAAEAVRGIRASLTPVQKPRNWVAVQGDPTKIAIVDTTGKAHTVTLPKDSKGKQIVSGNVLAAGLSANGAWSVEVKGENVFGGKP